MVTAGAGSLGGSSFIITRHTSDSFSGWLSFFQNTLKAANSDGEGRGNLFEILGQQRLFEEWLEIKLPSVSPEHLE